MAAQRDDPFSCLTRERDEILVGACGQDLFDVAAFVCIWFLASLETVAGLRRNANYLNSCKTEKVTPFATLVAIQLYGRTCLAIHLYWTHELLMNLEWVLASF